MKKLVAEEEEQGNSLMIKNGKGNKKRMENTK